MNKQFLVLNFEFLIGIQSDAIVNRNDVLNVNDVGWNTDIVALWQSRLSHAHLRRLPA